MGAALARTLAELADLPLGPGCEAAVGALLDAWLPAANELSRKMSAAPYQTLLPATVFMHPGLDDEF